MNTPANPDSTTRAAPGTIGTAGPAFFNPEEQPGTLIGRYKIMEKVGEGGFGVVYVAEQKEPVKRRVALKIIKLGMDTRQVVARFEAERQALALMDHPHIAKVLDAGSTDLGRPYFVMELVRGIKITDYCDQHKIPTRQRMELFIHVCQAIQHAHQKGIIHRDIKPSNILVTLHDGVPVPKVIDFGIAKATQQDLTDKTLYTQLQQFIGTPAYMSPEQAEMSGLDIDTRSDIYSLGVLLYELLTGRTPFDGQELMQAGIDAMRKTIRDQEPVRPSTKVATLQGDELTMTASRHSSDPPKLVHLLRGDLDWVVMKCLEKDRTRRYETANGLAVDLQRHLNNETVSARPPSSTYRFQKMVRRNKFAVTAVAAIACALLLGIIVSTWLAIRAHRAEALAVQSRTDAEKLSNFMLDDFYAEIEPSGRFETVANLAKQAMAYYDGLPPSLRTPETDRNRAMAQARLAWIIVQQGEFQPGLAAAQEAVARLDQLWELGDQRESTACAIALALQAQGYVYDIQTDGPAMRASIERAANLLRPFVTVTEASRRTKLLYADVLNYVSYSQTPEQGILTCQQALNTLVSLGALDATDLDAASAWVDIGDTQARSMFDAGRLDEADQQERAGLALAQRVLERRPGDLRARRDLFYTTYALGLIEARRFHDGAAMDWFRQCYKASEDFIRLNPSEGLGWFSLVGAESGLSTLLFRSGRVSEAIDRARATLRLDADHTALHGTNTLQQALIAWHAQRGNLAAAQDVLRTTTQALENFANKAATSPQKRIASRESRNVAERKMNLAVDQDALVLTLAAEALPRIDKAAKDVEDPSTRATLNNYKRQAFADTALASLKLHQPAQAQTAARAMLALPLLQTQNSGTFLLAFPDDDGWPAVLLAQAQLAEQQAEAALQTLAPSLASYAEMQAQGATYLGFRQHYARALYVQALAQPATPAGTTQRRASLTHATELLYTLSQEAQQLHDTKELLTWITAAQNS